MRRDQSLDVLGQHVHLDVHAVAALAFAERGHCGGVRYHGDAERVAVDVESGEAPAKVAEALTSALDTVAVRIDHVVVAVTNLDTATRFLATLGFTIEPSSDPFIRVADAGGVTVVLVGPDGDPAVRRHLDEFGSGVQHIAVEVLNAKFVQTALAEAGVPMLTDVVVDSAGHEQLFTVKDPATGVQIGFISRTGHREAISGDNVRALFRALDAL